MPNAHSHFPLSGLFSRAALGLVVLAGGVAAGCNAPQRQDSSPVGKITSLLKKEGAPKQAPEIKNEYNLLAAVTQMAWKDPKWKDWSDTTHRASETVRWQTAWTGTTSRHASSMNDSSTAVIVYTWMAQLDPYCGKSLAERAKAVDSYVDKYITYASDQDVYCASDYFACPAETIVNKKGDCDDYAVLKYYALRYLDVPPERMYVMLVSASNTEPLNHAVLTVDVEERPGEKANFVVLNNEGFAAGWGVATQTATCAFTPYVGLSEVMTLIFVPAPLKEEPPPAPPAKRKLPIIVTTPGV